ncbi:MAG: imidazole glycerol phosphate synthase subunit HisH [Alphaproteobacteria bacterium]|nr:imidazole glycerol phosphate synthase subunit HisH [Alphaproteobacteria bacterium]
MSVVLVDSGVANLFSVVTALRRLGVEPVVADDPGAIRHASRVILPGVGTARTAMDALNRKGLTDVLRGLTQPLLGICLGMQLLFERSTEGGDTPCLGIIPGTVEKLRTQPGFAIPHMGWDEVKVKASAHPLLDGVKDGSFVYFVHSFAAKENPAALAVCDYSETFTAIAGYKNAFGCQFHPERSGAIGQRILENFLGL